MPSNKFYLYQRSNGFWYIGELVDGRRAWKSTGKKTKADALKVLRDYDLKPRPKIVVQLLSDFAYQFLSLQTSNLRKSTLARIYSPAFKSFLNICGDKVLTRYTPRDVEIFKKIRLEQLSGRSGRKQRCSPTTVNIEFRTLRSAFNVAKKWNYIEDNPFIHSSQLRVPERHINFLTRAEFNLLLSTIKEPVLKDIVVFAVLTGLRLSELINLTWNDIDFQRQIINVCSKSDFTTKTGRNRAVPLNKFLIGILQGKDGLVDKEQYLFMLNGKKVQASYLSHRFKQHIRQAGLRDTIHFHSLRHTFATWLVQGGVNIYEVQKLLGHSSIAVTQIYSHLQPDNLHATINRITLEGDGPG